MNMLTVSKERPPELGQSRGIQMDPDTPADTAIAHDTLHKGEFDHTHLHN